MEIEDTRPGHLIRRLHQIAVGVFQVEVADLGFDLTPVQYAALAAIERNPAVDQATLAGLIAYDRTTISGVVDRLARKGLVEKEGSKTDRRANVLRITAEGSDVLKHIQPGVEETQATLLSGLTSDEAEAFLQLLFKAVDHLGDRSRARPSDVAALSD